VSTLSSRLKKEIIKLLKEDEEFRYIVAGLIGLDEILKRLDEIGEEQKKLREEQIKIGEEQIRLREEQIKIGEEQIRLRKEQIKIGEEQIRLREEQIKISEEQKKLREDFNKMLEEIKSINQRLGRLERTVEKITIDIEEEARSIVKHHLKQLGIEIELDVLKLPEAEINIYGANKDWCVIGEANLRAGKKLADEVVEKIKLLKERYPGYLRKNIIMVLYVAIPMPELVEEAKKRRIWLLKATKEYNPLRDILEE
jgi:chromosome segregation ATPase